MAFILMALFSPSGVKWYGFLTYSTEVDLLPRTVTTASHGREAFLDAIFVVAV